MAHVQGMFPYICLKNRPNIYDRHLQFRCLQWPVFPWSCVTPGRVAMWHAAGGWRATIRRSPVPTLPVSWQRFAGNPAESYGWALMAPFLSGTSTIQCSLGVLEANDQVVSFFVLFNLFFLNSENSLGKSKSGKSSLFFFLQAECRIIWAYGLNRKNIWRYLLR